jgi:hypothetical protein
MMSGNGNGSGERFQNVQMHAMSNGLEVLTNLVYLTRHESLHPEKVCLYMDMADRQLSLLAAIMKEVKSR